MSAETPPSKSSPRKPYEPPALEELKLEGEEMAAASCKTTISVTGPAMGCIDTGCRDIGS